MVANDLSESISDMSSKSYRIDEESKSENRRKNSNTNISIDLGSISNRTIVSDVKETDRKNEMKTDRNLLTRGNQNKIVALERIENEENI